MELFRICGIKKPATRQGHSQARTAQCDIFKIFSDHRTPIETNNASISLNTTVSNFGLQKIAYKNFCGLVTHQNVVAIYASPTNVYPPE
jgi:hypothetical protein